MKLLEITKSKITKDKNGENMYHLEITEVVLFHTKSKMAKDENGENMYDLEITKLVLFHCNIVNKDYQ